MSTKKSTGHNKRPERTSEPQGLKPASSLSSDGTAESRALPVRALPEQIHDVPKRIDETSSNPPEGQIRKPEVVAVADQLHSAAIHLLRRVRKQDVATGDGPARLSALSVLVFGGPKTLGELAAAEQVKPPTMSRIVAGLAKSRLVDIAVDPGDARRMHIRATAKGRSILEKGRDRRIAYLASRLDRLTPEELKSLDDAVQILNRALREWD